MHELREPLLADAALPSYQDRRLIARNALGLIDETAHRVAENVQSFPAFVRPMGRGCSFHSSNLQIVIS